MLLFFFCGNFGDFLIRICKHLDGNEEFFREIQRRSSVRLRRFIPLLFRFPNGRLSGRTRMKKVAQNHPRYAVRLKRADTKKALKDFLLYGKPSSFIEDEDSTQSRRSKTESRLHEFDNCLRSKSSVRSKPSSNSSECGKGKRRKGKRWNDKWSYGYYDDDFGHHEAKFQASFGGHKTFNWSFPSWENYRFENSTSGFEWRDEAKWEKIKKKFLNESDIEEEDPTDVGTHTDRVALGLPAIGSLKLDDVKTAFRTSALKWHPDKHQGPSQAVAAEKFKRCVDAYNSLCNALKNN